MGLDSVELVMEIEEEFAVAISDEVAPTLGRMGELRDFVEQMLADRGEAVSESNVWERLKVLVGHQLGVDPATLRPETHLVHDLGMD